MQNQLEVGMKFRVFNIKDENVTPGTMLMVYKDQVAVENTGYFHGNTFGCDLVTINGFTPHLNFDSANDIKPIGQLVIKSLKKL